LLDLWLDLREKRLAPVAVLLLGAIVAVPIVLAKNHATPAPAPTQTATTASAAPVVVTQPPAGRADSKLQVFSARDPFEPTQTVSPSSGTNGTAGTPTTPAASTPAAPTTPGGNSGGGGATGTQPTPSTGGKTGGTTGETKTTLFTYTVDFKFGPGGDQATFTGVKRLQLIPDEKQPKIVFLGVTTTGKTAVFLVDSSIGVDTAEGKCRPSNAKCTFLYLRPDKGHDQATLTESDGTVYHLRLLTIDRVSVSSANGKSGTTGSAKGNSKSRAFTGKATVSGPNVPSDTPPGEPTKSSSFQQFFADSGQ
jgi:hypothetical protein